MKLSTDVTRFATLMIMLGAVGSLTISSVPIASAMNTPDYERNPLVPFQDQEVTIMFTGNAGGGAPHSGPVIRVLQPPVGIPDVNPSETQAGAGFPASGICDPLLHDGDQIAWELRRDANGNTVYDVSERVSFVLEDGDEIIIKFGSGGPSFVLNDAGAPSTVITPNVGTFAWVEVVSGLVNTDNTSTIGNGGYFHGTCGTETGGGFQSTSTFTVSERIAGTVIPVDTTALLIAGATTNALWILPMIGAVATGFGIFTLKRKQN